MEHQKEKGMFKKHVLAEAGSRPTKPQPLLRAERTLKYVSAHGVKSAKFVSPKVT